MDYYYITPEHYEAAASNGISENLLYHRVYAQGMSIDSAIHKPLGKRNAYGWKEWKDVALKNGIQYRTYLERIKREGMTFEQAATTSVRSTKETIKRMHQAKKRAFTSEQLETAKKNNLSYCVIWNRVKVLKWSVEKAVTEPVMSNKEALERARQADNPFREKNKGYWDLLQKRRKSAT